MSGSFLNSVQFFFRIKPAAILINIVLFFSAVYSSEDPWILQKPSLTPSPLRTVKFVTPSTGWAAGRRYIFKSIDSGKTWHEQHNPCDNFVTSFFFHDTLNGWATGYSGGTTMYGPSLMQTTDGGENWEVRDVPATQRLLKILFLNRAKGWIIQNGKDNSLLETTDSGKTWKPHTLPWRSQNFLSYGVNDLVFVNDSTGFAACDFEMFRTTDGGATWAGIDSSNVPEKILPYYKISMVNDSTGYLIGWFGIAKTTDGGLTWQMQIQTPFQGPRFECFNYTSIDTAYAFYGYNPVSLFKTVDGGQKWTYGVSNIFNSVMDVSRTSWYNAIAVGENGAIYNIQGALDSMSEVTSGTGVDLACIDFCESRYGIAGKRWDAGKILLTDDGGKSWYEKPVYIDTLKPQAATTTLRFDTNTIYVGGYDKNLTYLNLISLDNGNTWKDVSDPGTEGPILNVVKIAHSQYGAYAITAAHELLVTQDIRFKQWEKRTVRVNRPIYFYNKDTAWALVDSNVLFTRDGAQTWDTLCKSCNTTGGFIIDDDIFFVTPKVGWIGGVIGTMETQKAVFLRTDDGGKTWVRQENVTILADHAIPGKRTLTGILKIWAINTTEAWALDKSGLLHTRDGGNTWVESSLPLMPLELYGMYCDSNSRWVVGAGDGIWKQGKDIVLCKPQGSQKRFSPSPGIIKIGLHGENIDFELASAKTVIFRVMTITGRTAAKFTISANAGKNMVRIKDIPIPSGVYCYSVTIDGGKENRIGRLVKYTHSQRK
jgi:photosystem II stability/assembly factor-like uncharacterized protein